MDFNKMLGSLNSSGISKGLLGGLAGGAVAGGLMSKKGRKMGKKALKYGGMAAVGGLAWKAYQNYQNNQQTNQQATPQAAPAAANAYADTAVATQVSPVQQLAQGYTEPQFQNLSDDDSNQDSLFILKVMVAAAMADGHMDANEYSNIICKASELGLDADEQRVIFDEIKQPMNVDQIAAQTATPIIAMEVYTASVLAIDETSVLSQGYLNNLATKLELPQPLVDSVHQQVAQV